MVNDAMRGKICLVTGASGGIGQAAALGLAQQGATVVVVARDRTRGAAAMHRIQVDSGNGAVDLVLADLSSQRAIRTLAATIQQRYERLDVLINNAGGVFSKRQTTEDGIEWTLALNHLAPFLLTNLLLDMLTRSATPQVPARIVTVSSGAQGIGKINFDDLQGAQRYSGFRAYSQSKLANVLFTYELARRLAGSSVTANCLHPGVVSTGFGKNNRSVIRVFAQLGAPFMRSPAQGADTVIYLASSPDVVGVTGKYFYDRKPVPSSKQSYDEAIAQRLWDVSAQLTGLAKHADLPEQSAVA